MKRKLTVLSLLLLLFTLAFSLVACGGGGNSGVSGDGCEHEWKESIDFEATCTEKGGKTLYCMKCDETRQDVIEPLGHDIVVTQGKAPTCTEGGLTDGEFCNRCNNTIKEQTYISPKNHTEVKVPGVAATCEEDGLTDGYYCSVCQTVLVEQTVIPSDGHNIETIWGYAATCTEAGLTNGERCTRCDYKLEQTVISANGHSEEIDEGYAATCTEAGLSDRKYCTTCWTTLVEEEVIPALGHSIKNYTSVNATCKDNGVVGGKYCERCQFVFEESTVNGKGNHKFVNGVCEYCEIKTSSGLAFEAVDGGLYQVSGIGSCTDTVVVIPDEHEGKAVVGIKAGAFAGSSITEVIVTDNVTYVGDGAFEGCSSLKSVTLSKSVVSVGENAFDACTALEEIKCADFYQTAGWHHNYFGSTRAKIVADTVNGMKPHEIYEMAMSSINANLNNYAFDDVRRLSVDKDKIPGYDSLDPTTKLFLDLIEMEFRTYAEFSGNDFYIYQYEKSKDVDYSNGMNYTAIDVSSFSKLWYYDGYYYQQQGANGVVTPNSSVKKSMGTLYVKDKLATTLLYVYTEDFFKDANFVINSDGSVSLTINVSGDAMTEFLYIMAEMNEALEDTFKQLDFAYTDVTYIYNFDKNGNISEILCDAGFRFAGTGDGYLTGTIAIEQSFSEVGTLEEIVTKPTGEFKDASYPYTCSHTSKKTVEGYAATCEKEGLTDGAYCLSCLADITLPSTIAAKNHNVVNYTCTKCGEKMGFSAGLKYDYNADGKTATLIGLGTCRDENIIIPTEINGIVITKIAKDAFRGSFVKSIKIPSSVASVESGAFDGAEYLEKISLSAVLVKHLPKTLVEVEITDGDTIKAGSFENFKNLTTITIGQSVETIEDGAFVGCDRLFIIYDYSDLYIEAGSEDNGGIAKNALDVNAFGETDFTVLGDFIFKFERKQSYSDKDKYYLYRYIGSEENLVLPEDFKGNDYIIYSNAFDGVTSIKSIIAPANVTAKEDAFEGCTSVISYAEGDASLFKSLPIDNLVDIHVYGTISEWEFFKGAPELVSVTLDASITGGSAFIECPKLTTVTIGSGVESIHNTTFNELEGLDLHVESLDVWFSIDFGYTSVLEAFDTMYVGGEETRNFIVPESVTAIPDNVFSYASFIDSITLHSGVEYIGEYAFCASSISEVYLNKGLVEIADCAFANAEKLVSIDIPEGVVTIGDSAFSKAVALVSVKLPETLEKIGNNAFYYTISLVSVNLPDGLTEIGSSAFKYATSLKEITIPSSVAYIPHYCFMGASSLEKVTVLSYDDGEFVYGAEKIYNEAFTGCDSLEEVYLGKSVKELGTKAFYKCASLKILELEGIERIGEYAFYYNGLTYLNLPETVKTIDSYAFTGISATSITLPASLETLGDSSFANSRIFEIINNSSILIDETHDSGIAENAYVISSGVESAIDYVGDYGFITVEGDGVYLIDYVGTERIISLPESYNEQSYKIASYAFHNTNVVSVVFSSGVSYISERAFSHAYQLVSIKFLSASTRIERYAFWDVTKLIEIITPEGSNMGNLPYGGKKHNGETLIDYTADGFMFYTDADEKTYIVGYYGNEKDIVLPEFYNDAPYHVRTNAFNDSAIKSVVVPDTVLSLGSYFVDKDKINATSYNGVLYVGNEENPYMIAIGLESGFDLEDGKLILHDDTVMISASAFSGKTSIKTIDFGESLKYIGAYAFENCYYLESVVIPDTVEIIENDAFYYCYALTELTLGSGLTTIGAEAFFAAKIVELTIPENIKRIEHSAFEELTALEKIYFNATAIEHFGDEVFYSGYRSHQVEVVIGDGVTVIPDYAFGGSDGASVSTITVVDTSDLKYIGSYAFGESCTWEEIELPNVEELGVYAFENAVNLKSIKFSDSLKKVGDRAFKNCTALEKADLGNNAEIGDYIFQGCTALKELRIPLEEKTLAGCFQYVGYYSNYDGYVTYETHPSLIVPSTLTKVELTGTKVFEFALNSCSSVRDIVFGDGITEIGAYAFYDLFITDVELPDGLKSIGTYAFASCNNLERFVAPASVETIGEYILAYAESLEYLELPFVGTSADEPCVLSKLVHKSFGTSQKSNLPDTLKTVKLNNVSTLLADAFSPNWYNGNVKIEEVIIEGEITEILGNTFCCMDYLNSVTLPEGLEVIGDGVFDACPKLATVNIPASVTKIGSQAFRSCNSLTSVSFGNVNGWSVDGAPVTLSETDTLANAQALKTNTKVWTRTEE